MDDPIIQLNLPAELYHTSNKEYVDLEIQNKYSDKIILVIEPLMSLFQAFMESVDLKPFIFNTTFIIAEPPSKILVYHEPKNWKVYKHPASMKISNIYYKRMDRAREVSEYLAKSKLKILIKIKIYLRNSSPIQFLKQL